MKRSLLLVISFAFIAAANAAPNCFDKADFEYSFSGMLKEDMFAANNYSLFNSCNDFDRVWFMRHTLDYFFKAIYGKEKCGYPLAEFNFSVRNKGVWGNPSTLAQMSSSDVKILDVLTGEHNHFFPRNIFWMREAWLRFSVPDAFQLSLNTPHTFMLGFFPFQLGRGIALGDAYATGQDFLGFYTDGLVDQFAPGMKLSGEFVKNHLFYDAYAACLENFCTSINDNGAKIRAQEFGHRLSPARGFGRINFLVANRLRWFVNPSEAPRNIIIEPYFLYNSDPEQDIEFTADAAGKLATFGVACDFVSDTVSGGFEYAFNVGKQEVRGWDRNIIQFQNRNGQVTSINSHVYLGADPLAAGNPSNLDLYKDPHSPTMVSGGAVSSLGKQAQTIIEDPTKETDFWNGKLIGVVPGLSAALPNVPNALPTAVTDGLYNAPNRYRNPYNNIYKGWMFVGDIQWALCDKQVKLGAEAGIASGDDNPNFETKDGDFTGFLGLQEVYSGRKVKSAFVLGGAGKIKRPLSAPEKDEIQAPNQFASSVSGFTNLIYSGVSCNWVPNSQCKRLSINPNILAFWQAFSTPKFDRIAKKNGSEAARDFLGIEANLFAHYMLYDSLRLFLITSVFVPGAHYSDIKGQPFNSEQQKQLDKFNQTGFDGDAVPNISDNPAFTFNIGLEFKF